MTAAMPSATSSRRRRGFALGLVSVCLLAACNDESEGGASVLFEKEGRVLAETVEIGAAGLAIEIDPPLAVQNTVQYVGLMIPGANQWRSGPRRGELLTGQGETVRIRVELEAESGERYLLDSPSFGQALMFSHVDSAAPPDAPDLPREERFVRLWLSADPPLTAEQVVWSDITNK